MSKRKTLKIDLRRNARDFVAVPWNDFPMLDLANLNDNRLHRVFGRLLGHAERKGDTVNFFIVNDHGNCPYSIECEPATSLEIQKNRNLREDLTRLQQKLYPKNGSEVAMDLRGVRSHFEELRRLPKDNQSAHFWKWRIHQRDPWKLVWFWGFAAKDLELCGPAICTNVECENLFLLRNGTNNCPLCGGTGQRTKIVLNETGDKNVTWATRSDSGRLGRSVAALFLLLLLGAILLLDLSPASRYSGWLGFGRLASFFSSRKLTPDPQRDLTPPVAPPET
ncbi:MAG: hypothetical protein KGQ60_12690, partial [Planctomycetes bacterium]|nr:hypothetical protein [Planctomycetota bacterium]